MLVDRSFLGKSGGLRRTQSSSQIVDNNSYWNRIGRLILYSVVILSACWSIAYANGLFPRTSTGEPKQQTMNTGCDKADISTRKSVDDIAETEINLRTRQPPFRHPGKSAVTKEFIRGLFELWNDALATGDADQVTQRYGTHATLLPTMSNQPRTDYESIKAYFDIFLKKQPKGRIVQGFVQIGENFKWAQDNGIYEFTMGVDGSVVRARYSFIYQIEDDDEGNAEWKIIHHHSSLMPESR
jgi:hypothetical protein